MSTFSLHQMLNHPWVGQGRRKLPGQVQDGQDPASEWTFSPWGVAPRGWDLDQMFLGKLQLVGKGV